MFYDRGEAHRQFKNNKTTTYPNLGGSANKGSVGTHRRLKGWQLWLIIVVFLGAAAWLFGWLPW